MEDNYETYDQLMGYKNVEHKDLPPVGGVLSGTVDLGIETALANRVNDLTKELEVVKASNDDWRERFGKEQNKIYEIRNNLGELLKTQIEHELITNTGAKEIAELVGIELTKTVTVTGTVSFQGTIEISIFDDADELSQYDLDVDMNVTHDYDCINNFDYDVESMEFEEE
jgi:hypothetical protein